ncbi:hypothetical protein [Azospira inquinata]|uniref:Uncharacterized protein n=1 Tax=Azospira inquinata TaxID=2785627 RepID=A0A975XU63_9RHOO|nr:hypothetical protein [Azospira inquinata]QWT46217.1 hypothetical protein J8L76_00465 [Azospira inquinata]QWT48454.1 hypothetical protein Azoinq_11400 [Azospira inquinata]
MKKTYFYDLLIVVLVLALGYAGYRLAPLLHPQADLTLPMSNCDLNRNDCRVQLPEGGSLGFRITPRPIPSLKTLDLEVQLTGTPAQKVEVDLAGADMEMGYNRPLLQEVAPGRFTGTGSLQICITGAMHWQATVLVDTGRRHLAVPFHFLSGGAPS